MVSARFYPLIISRAFMLFAAFLGLTCAVQAQSSARPLITSTIDESSLVTLRGNVHPLAQSRFDRGRAPISMTAQRLVLVLRRSPRQESALRQYLDSVQDKNSPNFHHFLTPEQFGRQYGPADEDILQIVTWLSGRGFSVGRIPKSKMAIEFSGSVGQIEEAFHTQIDRFSIDGQEHLANISDPMIPSALVPVVAGISPLNNFYPQPQVVHGPGGRWNASQERFDPDLTVSASGTQYLFVGPGDAATIYDSPNSLNTHLQAGQTTYDGAGTTIGIVSNENINIQNVARYRSLFGLPAGSISIVTDGNAPDSSHDDVESTLDGEVSGAIAPGAAIVYYQAADTTLQSGVILAILRAVEDNTVDILNVSYGGCELAQGSAGNQEILNIWEQAAAQGIAVTVSSGDSGSAGCDDPDSQTTASHGFGVNGLASTPYTVAVGGTDFDVLPSKFSQYVSSTNSANNTSALGYVPENPWNNSTNSNGTLANNQASEDSSGTNIVAGGGGASSAALYDTNGNLLGGYAKPLWQQQYETSVGLTADQVRDVPDVSLLAANGFYRAVWATCGDSDCGGPNPTISGVGGTSASAPAFAGILALVNQRAGATTRLGQPNWVLYSVAHTHPEAFHPVTTGNNSVVCVQGTSNCAANNFLSGYDAGPSYNLATGLGGVDISSLVNNWTSVARTQTTTSLSLNPMTVQHGHAVAIGVDVSPAGATGNVAITTNNDESTGDIGSDSQTNYTLSSGQATGSWFGFPGGTYNVYANYSGDGSYAGSVSAPTQITVTPENSIVQLSVTTVNASGQLVSLAGGAIPYGSYVSVDAQPIGQSQASNPNPLRNATGEVVFSDTGSGGGGTVNVDASGNAELPVHYTLGGGPHAIAATYIGDKSYNSSTSATISFTVQKGSVTTSVTSSTNAIYSGDFILSATVNPVVPDHFSAAVDGTLTFTDTTTNTVLATVGVTQGGNATTGFNGTAFIDVDVTQLVLGNNSIIATYNGGSNYVLSAASAPVIVACTAGCGNGTGQSLGLGFYQSTPQSHIISPGVTSTTPVAVSPQGGFTGAVNLTCSVMGTKSGDANIPQCSFNPTTVTITDTNAVQSTLTVTTTAAGTSAALIPGSRLWSAARASFTLACVAFLGFSTRRRCLATLRVVLCLAVLGGLTACGGGAGSNQSGGGGGPAIGGTTPDTYTITFQAADAATGKLTAQDYFTLQVN